MATASEMGQTFEMTDFIPPSEPEREPSDPPPSAPDWGGSPPTQPIQGGPGPAGQAPEPSPWGAAPRPSDWGPQGGGQGQPPAYDPGYGQPGYGQPDPGWSGYGAAPTFPRSSQATTALVLSVVGLFCCGLPAVIGTIMAKGELNAINRGETDPANQGTAQAGFILGLIASILWLAMVALYVLAIAASIAGSTV